MYELFEKETVKTKPFGILYTHQRKYWLLSPHPVPGDSWEGDNAYRFLVVPFDPVITRNNRYIRAPARHIVTTSFTAEYVSNLPVIEYKVFKEE